MSKTKQNSSAKTLKVRLLSMFVMAVILVLLFMLQNSNLSPQRLGILKQAAEMSLPLNGSLTALQPGTEAPDFALTGVNRDVISLSSHAGRKVALVFGNKDCPYCQVVVSALSQLCSSSSVSILVIMVSPDPDLQAQAPCLRVLEGSPDLFKTYRVTAIPTIYLLDGAQRVIASKSNFSAPNSQDLVAELASFLER